MTRTNPIYIPWRDRAAVTKREAAAISARSLPWIDNEIREGRLISYQTRRNGPHLVCAQSLSDLLDNIAPSNAAPRRPDRSYGRPRLVWSNPTI